MANEWNSNIWMVIQFIIIGVSMCVLTTMLASVIKMKLQPKGFDKENLFVSDIASIPEDSPEYIEYGEEMDKKQERVKDVLTLIDRLKQNPEVEAVSTGSYTAIPYCHSFWGSNWRCIENGDTVVIPSNVVEALPSIASVLRYEGLRGETPAQLEQILEKGEIIVAEETVKKFPGQQPLDLIGKEIFAGNDTWRIGAVVRSIKRDDYEVPYSPVFIIPTSQKDLQTGKILIRLKEGVNQDKFIGDTKKQLSTRYIVRNTYLSNIVPIEDFRSSSQKSYYITELAGTVCMIFLMVSIFLGMLGTFWFRTQQRVGEIAIRKVNGATSGSLFRRLISEGLLMLLIATPFIVSLYLLVLKTQILIEYGVIHTDTSKIPSPEIAINILFVVACLVLMILLGIWFPARKAMKINPAIALKDE